MSYIYSVTNILKSPQQQLGRQILRFALRSKKVGLIPFGVIAGALTTIVSLTLLYTLTFLFPALLDYAPELGINLKTVLLVVVFAPVIESVVVTFFLYLLAKIHHNVFFLTISSGILWGILHGLDESVRFFGTFFSFIIFSASYLLWRKRSYWFGLAAASIPHMVVNACVVVIVLLSEPL